MSLKYDNNSSYKDAISPYKIVLLFSLERIKEFNRRPITNELLNQDMCSSYLGILELIQGPDMDFLKLFYKLHSIAHWMNIDLILQKISIICNNGLHYLIEEMKTLPVSLLAKCSPFFIYKSSIIGLFIRQISISFEQLTFDQVLQLYFKFRQAFDDTKIVNDAFYLHLMKEDHGSFIEKSELHSPSARIDNNLSLFQALITTDIISDSKFEAFFLERDRLALSREKNEEKNPLVACRGGNIDVIDDDNHWQSIVSSGYSQKQAEVFIARQAFLLHYNELEALTPYQLQQKLKEILESNPDIIQAYFLKYLNYMRINEYRKASHCLTHYFDKCLIPRPLKIVSPNSTANKEEEICFDVKTYRYAALNMASFHFRYGHRKEAEYALQECIKLSQEKNDSICLQHALSWLEKLTCYEVNNCKYLLSKLISASKTLNQEISNEAFESSNNKYGLVGLTTMGYQSLVQHSFLNTSKPNEVLNYLAKSELEISEYYSTHFICNGLAQKATLFHFYGQINLCLLTSQVLLGLNSQESSVYHNSEAECLALCQVATSLANKGLYDNAYTVIEEAKKRFNKSSSQYSRHWMLCQEEIKFTQYLLQPHYTQADQAVKNIGALNPNEGKYARCLYFLEIGQLGHALDSVKQLIEICKFVKPSQIQTDHLLIRCLLLKGNILISMGSHSLAIKPLIEALTSSKKHHYTYLSHLAINHIAQLQLNTNFFDKADSLVDQTMVYILSRGSLLDQARTMLLSVKCKLMLAKKDWIIESIKKCVERLNDVRNIFIQLNANARHKEVLYLQSRLCREIGLQDRSNQLANLCLNIHSQYPTNRSPLASNSF